MIAGLEVAAGGEILIAGKAATRDERLLIPPHRRGIAMLFQDLALWPNLTVAGNVHLGLSGLRLSRNDSGRRVQHARIVERGTVGEIRANPQSTLGKAFSQALQQQM